MSTTNASHRAPRKSLWKALVLGLLAVAAAAFLLPETAWSQEGPESEYVDLIMFYEQGPEGESHLIAFWVENRGNAPATGVTVSFLLEDLVANISDDIGAGRAEVPPITGKRTENGTNERFTWEIGTMLPGRSSNLLYLSVFLHPGRHSEAVHPWPGRIGVVNATASALHPEPGLLSANNVIKLYSFMESSSQDFHMRGNRLALLLSVDDLEPDAGGHVNFDLTADNRNKAAGSNFINLIADINIKVELSDGLEFKEGWVPPSEFVKSDSQSATWRPGAVDTMSDTYSIKFPSELAIEIQTQLSSEGLDDIPREERCITAWVADSTPPPSPGYILNSLTECLGDDPPVLFETGEVAFHAPFPCLGTVTFPCRDEDNNGASDNDIEIAAWVSDNDSTLRNHGVGRVDEWDWTVSRVILRPESVFIQVKDPQGRIIDNHANSVNTGTAPS